MFTWILQRVLLHCLLRIWENWDLSNLNVLTIFTEKVSCGNRIQTQAASFLTKYCRIVAFLISVGNSFSICSFNLFLRIMLFKNMLQSHAMFILCSTDFINVLNVQVSKYNIQKWLNPSTVSWFSSSNMLLLFSLSVLPTMCSIFIV